MDNKNIIFFNSASSIDLIGGSQRSIDYLILNLHKKFKIFYICWNFKRDKLEINKFKTHTIIKIPHPKKNILSFIYNYLKIIKIYKSIFNTKTLLWAHSPLPFFFFKLVNKISGKYLYSVHGPLITEINYYRKKKVNNFLINIIYNYILKDAKKIIFNSFYTLRTSINESNFLHSKNLEVKELLVDEVNFIQNYKKIKSNYKKTEFHNGNFYLIPRRLVKRTGVYKFIKQIIRKKINLIHRFYITGEGDQHHDIKNLCDKSINIIFLGNIDQDLLTYLISISKGIVIPSLEAEGFCIVAKEARLLNKFVIHTNQGGLRESLAGYKNQLIFDFANININMFSKKKLVLNKNKIIYEKNIGYFKKLNGILKI